MGCKLNTCNMYILEYFDGTIEWIIMCKNESSTFLFIHTFWQNVCLDCKLPVNTLFSISMILDIRRYIDQVKICLMLSFILLKLSPCILVLAGNCCYWICIQKLGFQGISSSLVCLFKKKKNFCCFFVFFSAHYNSLVKQVSFRDEDKAIFSTKKKCFLLFLHNICFHREIRKNVYQYTCTPLL